MLTRLAGQRRSQERSLLGSGGAHGKMQTDNEQKQLDSLKHGDTPGRYKGPCVDLEHSNATAFVLGATHRAQFRD